MATITKDDILTIAQISTHCDLVKLNIAITEARDFDLDPLFCPNWDEIQSIFDKVEANEVGNEPTVLELNLINGGEFESCSGKTLTHKGVRSIWNYYAFARYLTLNGFNDTPNGNVAKTNNFSLPTPLKEVEMFADKYRSMGYISFGKTERFLCANKDQFTDLDIKDCGCGCGDKCGGNTMAKGYGFKLRTVNKNIGFSKGKYSNAYPFDGHIQPDTSIYLTDINGNQLTDGNDNDLIL